MAYVLLHNPRCSKSRGAVALLQERGVTFDVREYLKEPLSLDELRILKAKLRREPSEWLRWGQDEVKAAGVSQSDPPMALLHAMAEYPILMERPILISEDAAAVGRPSPEAILELID